ncbi:phosphatidylinositol-specific phospholipase C [Flavobacterium pedocola]
MANFTENWMSYLDDSKKLSQLTIPGTHDSCTYRIYNKGGINTYGTLGLSDAAICQTMSITEQLNKGIRFLDIRLKGLNIYHNTVDLKFTWDEMIRDCISFLDRNPSESIIMSVKDENKETNETLYNILWPKIEGDHRWCTKDEDVTLKDIRNKLVLFRRFYVNPKPHAVGIDAYSDWPQNSTKNSDHAVKMRIQDEYQSYVLGQLDHKYKNYVLPRLEEAKRGDYGPDRLYVNFTSGTGGVFPATLATGYNSNYKGTNYWLNDYFINNPGKQAYGIIPMDFPESEPNLIRKLIGSNFDPYHEIIFQQPTTFKNETDGTWTMSKPSGYGGTIYSGNPNLIFIKTANTPSGNVEMHISPRYPSDYQNRSLETATAFKNETNGTWLVTNYQKSIFNFNTVSSDLVFIKTSNTASKKVEVHIASEHSGYQSKILQTATCFDCENDGVWAMANYDRASPHPDLIYIKTRNTESNKVEVHIASGISNYQKMILQTVTTFDCEQNGIWTIANHQDAADLAFIKTKNTPSGAVEVHIASSASQYKTRTMECPTAFKCQEGGTWLMQNFTVNNRPDLIFIKTANTPNNHVEVHVASGNR